MRSFTINVFFLLALSFTKNVCAQVVLGTPNLGFTQACASPSFNSYNATFTFSPESSVNASNQFIIELSDASGSFIDATVIYTSTAGSVVTSPATLNFSFPETVAGEGYKIRIKSTSPASTSSSSVAFPAYFKVQDSPFSINNLVATAVYCTGGNYLLTIDNPGTGTNDSPLNYPSLTYNWYKELTSTTSVFVDSGSTLSVSEPGTYFVETNYGSCTSNSYSNRVTVSEASGGTAATVDSSLGNPFCPSGGATTLSSSVTGNSYQWYKDGQAITGETNQTYDASEAGTYAVDINFGSCTENASIDLQVEQFTSSLDVLDVNVIESDETLVATVTTDADTPQYDWYFNDTLISGAITSSYEVTQGGIYKVVITQTVGCNISSELVFEVQESNQFPDVADIPNVVSPNGDGINDTWVIPTEYVSGTNSEVLIISSQGKIVLKTNDYKNDWPQDGLNFKSVNPVYYYIITTQDNKTRKGSITVIK
ncbi:gliding motility-associated C-terminal domain-containing protein [Yeosuana marina]|uniref:T9SS type B sorting domain-containing protein n=1 Tax=Yeosuana marina TaxID=1565536 RepID=UPI0030ECED68|tara:strand:+ start:2458 stop:3903 length:1446 start_codon:yes stop_codon:yes gene_type:complete